MKALIADVPRGKSYSVNDWCCGLMAVVSRLSVNALLPAISHGPDRDLTGSVLISGPRCTADVQIRVRRAIEHHPRARVSHGVGQTATFGIIRPNDHPVRTIGIAGLVKSRSRSRRKVRTHTKPDLSQLPTKRLPALTPVLPGRERLRCPVCGLKSEQSSPACGRSKRALAAKSLPM